MFFQNPCGSQRRREILETNARAEKNRYSIPEELRRTGNKEGTTRVISNDPRGLGAKLHFYTPRKKILHQENYLRNRKRKNKQLWNIYNFSEDQKKRMIFYREGIVISPKFSLKNNILKARVVHLVSARPSVHEVLNLIPGDITSLFQLLSFLCSFD